MTQELEKFTHKDLVNIAYRWLLKNCSCGIAFKELESSGSQEIPDVIGFGAWGHSVLVEVKITRSDFLCDKRKPFRINPDEGMGKQRFYLCPHGLIKKEELPAGWGLVYVYEKVARPKVFNTAYDAGFDAGLYDSDNFNTHYKWFRTKESMQEWERGKRNAIEKNSK